MLTRPSRYIDFTRTGHSGRRCLRAFTLIELMVVMLIMGLLFGIVVLNIGSLVPGERIKSEARKIGGLLEKARSLAAVTGVNYALVYDLDKNEYWLLVPRQKTDGAGWDIDERKDNRRKSFITDFHPDIEIKDIQLGSGEDTIQSSGQVHVELTPLGTASGHVVHLIDTRTKAEYSIELNALTALVTFYPGRYELEELEDHDGF